MSMRVFIAAPAVKAGSTILSWLLSQHSVFGGNPILENIEVGAMLNVLDHIPEWRRKGYTSVGDDEMLSHIRRFVDGVANPTDHDAYGLKFTNFYSFNWLDHVFPADRKIVVVRNIFDWYASIKLWNNARHGGWKPRSVDYHLQLACASLAALPNIRVVHLEDLILDTQRTMKAVHEHLGLYPEPISLEGHREVFSSYTSSPSEAGHVGAGALATTPIGRGSNLTNDERADVERFAQRAGALRVLYDQKRRLF